MLVCRSSVGRIPTVFSASLPPHNETDAYSEIRVAGLCFKVMNALETRTLPSAACLSVVIVDDAPPMRERLKTMVNGGAPHAEVVGETGEVRSAIVMIQDRRPDVVILDLQLTGGSGFEVLRTVKRSSGGPAVIVLTNLFTLEYQLTCLEAGAEFFLDKSFGVDRLPDILNHLALKAGSDRGSRETHASSRGPHAQKQCLL